MRLERIASGAVETACYFATVFDIKKGTRRKASGELIGWVVLQGPLNKLDAVPSGHRGVGGTGETNCVDTEQRMVRQSRFRSNPTDLRLKCRT